jgi:multiple sugar transport system substrate-binding protein
MGPKRNDDPNGEESSAFSRRNLIAGGIGVVALGGLALVATTGRTPAQAAGRAELQFWHLLSGGDGQNMNAILNRVNREDKHATVNQTVLAWGSPYYTKLAMAAAGGRPPDMAIMHLSRLEGYAPGGLLDRWDLARFAKYGISESDFTKPTFARMHAEGGLFGIALDSHAFIRFFNPEIADKAGVLDSNGRLQPTTTVDEFIEQAKALQGVTKKLGLSYGYLGDASNMWRLFWTFYTQLGGTMAIKSGVFSFDQAEFRGALEAMQKILGSGTANHRSDDGFSFSAFTARQSGEMFTGVWDLSGLQGSKIPLDASPIPNLFGTGIKAAWGDSHSFVLPHQAAVDETRREQTYEAVSLILKSSLTWAHGGHTPAYQPVVKEAAFKKLEPNGHYAETAGYLHYDPALSFAGSGSNWQGQFGQSVQGALMGTESAADATDSFSAMTTALVRQTA